MKRLLALALGLSLAISLIHADERAGSIDFFLLMDSSLSMADAMADARRYAASEVVGRLTVPGDYVSVLEFFGSTKPVWAGDISAESDKAALVRSLNGLKADGRFTDIGAALDRLDALILERGHPERPKYILLITDERQEAPAGSPYYSPDYTIRHPLLTYVRRLDMGSFRVITIGYGLDARIEGEARSLMTVLTEPPSRPETRLPGSGMTATDASALGGPQASGAAGGFEGGSEGALDQGNSAPGAAGAAGSAGRTVPWWAWALIAAAGATVVLFGVLLARARRDRDEAKERRAPGGV